MPKKAGAKSRLTVSIVGAGNLGSALAVTLPSIGYEVKWIASRNIRRKGRELGRLARKLNARLAELGRTRLDTDITWITVPDDAIAATARLLASTQDWEGKFVFHSSGALTSDVLAALRKKGAKVAGVHPMMTFIRGSVPAFAGVTFAVEGDAAAVRTARHVAAALGGRSFPIKKKKKVLYHVFGSFASPLVIALLASLEQVAEAAGVKRREIKNIMAPLLWQTLRNYLKHDAPSAFSGPLVRGDIATVRKHLAALEKVPKAREVYRALAKAALGDLPVRNRKALERELLE